MVFQQNFCEINVKNCIDFTNDLQILFVKPELKKGKIKFSWNQFLVWFGGGKQFDLTEVLAKNCESKILTVRYSVEIMYLSIEVFSIFRNFAFNLTKILWISLFRCWIFTFTISFLNMISCAYLFVSPWFSPKAWTCKDLTLWGQVSQVESLSWLDFWVVSRRPLVSYSANLFERRHRCTIWRQPKILFSSKSCQLCPSKIRQGCVAFSRWQSLAFER